MSPVDRPQPGAGGLAIVFGPATRLAEALLATGFTRDRQLLLCARTEAEAERIRAAYPAAHVLPLWNTPPDIPLGYVRVTIVACALGVIHPDAPNLAQDMAAASRDLGALRAILEAYREARLDAVFVSSVLVLSPRPERLYYAGWKAIVESLLQALMAPHPRFRLCVLYPGRLVPRRSLLRPLSYLSTTYRRMALEIVRASQSDIACRTIIGGDARLWLLARGLLTGGRALLGAA